MSCPFRYRATSNVKLPLRIIATVNEIGTTQVSYTVSIKANFGNKLSATEVVLRIPTPLNTTTVDCKVANGKAKYVPAENVVIWKYVRLYHLSGTEINMLHPESPEYRAAKSVHLRLPLNSRPRQFDKSGLGHQLMSTSRS